MAKAHATAPASGAHRWIPCTKSLMLEAQFPPTTSPYAEEGTVAHELAEACAAWFTSQIGDDEYNERLAKVKESKYYSREMLEYCDGYGKFVRDRFGELARKAGGADLFLESRVDFSDWVPEGFGTADCLILGEGVMEVIDFKYGRGKRVDAKDNPQMKLYTLGAYQTYGLVYAVEKITMTIYQPRIPNGVTSDKIDLNELLDWADNVVKPRAKLALAGEGEFAPGPETCQFCRAKATCRARAEANLKLFDEAPDRYLLSVEEAGKLLEKCADIEAWVADLRAYVENTLLEGNPVPGWKLVAGRSVRKYADEDAVRRAMLAAGADEALLYKPRELVTLTQLEKDFGKKNVAEILGELIVKPAGKPTLAPESDRRPAVTPADAIVAAFDEGKDNENRTN